MLDWVPSAPYTAEQLLEVLRILRDPENGCPWDKVQTHASIRKNFLEETCEVLEAIDADDPAMLREELGDVLMQVAFHAVIEEERGRFTFEDVCREVCEKLVFRHPNIFASSAAQNAGINGCRKFHNVNCRFCGAIHSVNWACLLYLTCSRLSTTFLFFFFKNFCRFSTARIIYHNFLCLSTTF